MHPIIKSTPALTRLLENGLKSMVVIAPQSPKNEVPTLVTLLKGPRSILGRKIQGNINSFPIVVTLESGVRSTDFRAQHRAIKRFPTVVGMRGDSIAKVKAKPKSF